MQGSVVEIVVARGRAVVVGAARGRTTGGTIGTRSIAGNVVKEPLTIREVNVGSNTTILVKVSCTC